MGCSDRQRIVCVSRALACGTLALACGIGEIVRAQGVEANDAASAAAEATSNAKTPRIVPTAPRRLTSDGRLKRDPVFWPGRDEIVFTVEDVASAQMHLEKIDLESGETTPFSDDKNRSERELSISRDGSVWAYNTVSGLSSKIIVHDSQRQRVVTLPGMGRANWNNWPTVSPDGTRVVFVEAAAVIWSYDLVENKGKESATRLSPDGDFTVSDYWPRFSPDGKSIAFTSNTGDDFEIWVMRADGSGRRRLTRSPGIDMHPAYSPDGKQIAFTSNRDGNYEIWVLRADGSAPRRITEHPERDDYACWHPDGRSLVFVAERDGSFDLMEIAVDTRTDELPAATD